MNEKTKRYLIIGVAIFCLLVFSISPAVMGFFSQLFISERLGSIQMPNGDKVNIQIEDSSLASRLSRLELQGGSILAPFAWLSTSAAIGQRDRVNAFMILRRAAVTSGVDVSDAEVDKALDVGKQLFLSTNPEFKEKDYNVLNLLGAGSGVSSAAELRLLMREALRISSYVYLEVMGGLDSGDVVLSEHVRKDRETLALSYVRWAAKPLTEAYKKKPPSDDDLLEWVAKLEDQGLKSPLVDDVHVAWDMVYADYEVLDPKLLSEWTKGMAPVGDAEIEQYYDQNKAIEFVKEVKKPDDKDGDKPGDKDGDKPGDKDGDKKNGEGEKDADKKDANDKKQDEHGGLIQDDPPASKSAASETQGNSDTKGDADTQDGSSADTGSGDTGSAGQDSTSQDGVQIPGEVPPVPQGVGPLLPPQGPEFIPLDQVKEQIRRRLESQQLLEAIRLKAQDARTASLMPKKEDKDEKEGEDEKDEKDEKGEKGEKGEKEGEDEKAEFVLKTWLADQFEGGKLPKGLLYVSIPKAARPESFREGQPYGIWEGSYLLRQTVGKGDLGSDVQMAKNGAFFFQVTDRLEDVVRPIEEIRIEAQEIYAKQKALDEMKEKADAFRKLVRKKAEGLLPEKVAEMQKACLDKIDKDYSDWKKRLDDSVADTEKEIQAGNLPERSMSRRRNSIKAWKEELTKTDEKKEEIKKSEEDKLETEIKDLLEPKMAEAFGLALEEQSKKAESLGPFAKDSNKAARFSLLDDGPEKFLEGDATILEGEKGWVSDVMEDALDQSYYVVRMDERKDGGMELVTRRSMAERRENFSLERFNSILINAYSPKALTERFKYKSSMNGSSSSSADDKDESKDKEKPEEKPEDK